MRYALFITLGEGVSAVRKLLLRLHRKQKKKNILDWGW